MVEIKDVQKLRARERLEKLKEIKEAQKKEIETLIKETQAEAQKDEFIEKIPLPEVKKIDIEELFSTEEKKLFEEKPEEELEEKVLEEGIGQTNVQAAADYSKTLDQMSKQPVDSLYESMKTIYESAKSGAGITPEQWGQVQAIGYQDRQRFEDMHKGTYQADEEKARKMVATEKMKNWLQDKYHAGTIYKGAM